MTREELQAIATAVEAIAANEARGADASLYVITRDRKNMSERDIATWLATVDFVRLSAQRLAVAGAILRSISNRPDDIANIKEVAP